MNEEDKNNNRVHEPQAEYHKQEIHFFNSPDEMNEHQYRHWLGLTSVQRLEEHYSLVTRAYNYIDKISLYDKIYFD